MKIFDKLDEKLEGHKVYDFYYEHIWCPIWRTFYYKPKEFFHNVRMFFQRGKRGYTQEDYWALNYHLAKYLSNVLDDWAKNNNSYPITISGQKMTEDEWRLFLKESAKAFKRWVIYDESFDIPNKEEYDENMKKIKRFFLVMADNFEQFWD